MIKKRIKILLLFCVLFINISNVDAMSCAEVDQQVKKYDSIKEELKSVDCTKVSDSEIVNKCNKLNLERNNTISNIYQSSKDKNLCASQKKKTAAILKENENECGVVFGDYMDKVTNYVMGLFFLIGPILVILFGTLDFGMATLKDDPLALKKASNNFFKRLAALIALFLSPLLTKMIVNFNTTDKTLDGDAYSCNFKHILVKKEIKVVKVARANSKFDNLSTDNDDNDSSTGTKKVKGNFLSWKQYQGAWKNIQIGCGNVARCGCLVTSVSIQAANSGAVKSSSFDPSKFITTVKKNGGFTSGGGFTWTGWKSIAPNFQYVGQKTISGSLANKAKALSDFIESGYYPVAEVKKGGCGQHWVAIISVQGSNITMADPGSSATKLDGAHYKCFVSNSHSVALFKVKGK